MSVEWVQMEAGWYVAQRDGQDIGIGIVRDGQWHVATRTTDSESAWPTLREAMEHAEKLARSRARGKE